jgi:DNA-binding transcriptional LysR family regulator
MDVELRHLRSFVAVAEELNFTRAAERVHIAQPALSAHIRQLEERVGCRLVERTTRRVSLTPAGEALFALAPAALAGVADAVRAAQSVAAGETGSLVVGLLATSGFDYTPRVLRAFAAAHPAVEVSVRNVTFDDPSGGVRSGDTDLAIVWLPFVDDGLACEPLFDDCRLAVMAESHPLASREQLSPEELAKQPFVWVEDIDPVTGAFWTLEAYRAGRPLRIGARITGFEDMFPALRAGQAIAAIPESVARGLPFPDIVLRDVEGLAPATVALCRRADDHRPIVEAFAQVAHTTPPAQTSATMAPAPT